MGGRRKLPLDVARVTGATVRNAGRYRDSADPKVGPLGEPPEFLTAAEKAEWQSLATELPWLRRSDRCAVSIAARLSAQLAAGDLPLRMVSELRLIMSALCGTPITRGRAPASPDGPGDDPLQAFLRGE